MFVESASLENYGPFLSCRAGFASGASGGSSGGFRSSPQDSARNFSRKGSAWLVCGGSRKEQSVFLDGLARLLSCFESALRRSRRAGVLAGMPDSFPHRGPAGPASLSCAVRDGRSRFAWRLARAEEGAQKRRASALGDARYLAGIYLQRRARDGSASLPAVAFYQAGRAVSASPRGRRNPCSGAFAGFGALMDLLSSGGGEARFGHVSGMDFFQGFLPASSGTAGLPVQADRLKAGVLAAVRRLLPDCTDLAVRGWPSRRLLLQRGGQWRDLAFLPRSEALLCALAGDLAVRMVLLNPALENPLEGAGIAAIDGLGFCLPKAGRQEGSGACGLAGAVRGLREAFPCCQFIFSAGGEAGASPDCARKGGTEDGSGAALEDADGLALAEACGARPLVLEMARRPGNGGAD